MSYQTFENVDALDTEWIWKSPTVGPRIPRGALVVLYGPGAAGKGRLTWDLIGRVTTGRPMPFCETGGKPGSVVAVMPEDHLNEQQAKRLQESGADPKMVIPFTRLPGGDKFHLSADNTHEGCAPLLRALIEELKADGKNPAMIIIDPFAACVKYGSIQGNAGVRRALSPLQDIAEMTGVCVVVVAHEVTGGKLQGSMGFQQAARVVYRISESPENPRQKIFHLEKGNDLPPLEDLRYEITDDDNGKVSLTWLDSAEIEARARTWRTSANPPNLTSAPYYTAWYISQKGKSGGKELLAETPDISMALRACTQHPAYGPKRGWKNHVRKDKTINPNALMSQIVKGKDGEAVFMICGTGPVNTTMLRESRTGSKEVG